MNEQSPDRLPIACERTQEFLLPYIRNDLQADRRTRVEKHLAGCHTCRRSLHEVQALEAELYAQSALYSPRLSGGAARRAQARMERRLQKGVIMQRTWKLASGVIGLAGLAVLAVLIWSGASQLIQAWQPTAPAFPTQPAAPLESAGQDGTVTITFAHFESTRELYERLSDAFHQQNPDINVQLVEIPEGALTDYRSLASSADSTLLFSLADPATAGTAFRDLQPLIDSDATFQAEDFWPGMLEACQDAGGRMFGLPLYATLQGIFYDKAAFEAAGLAYPTAGWTWDDFRQAVAELADRQGESIRYGLADQRPLQASILGPRVNRHMPEAAPDELDAQALAEDLEWYFELVESGAIYRPGENESIAEWEQLFTRGAPPAMWVGVLSEPIPGSEQNLSPGNPLAGLAISEYGFVPFPVEANGPLSGSTPARALCAGISAGTQHPRAAWAWLSFLSRQRLSNSQIQVQELLSAPARQSVANASDFWEIVPDDVEDSIWFALEHAWYGSKQPELFRAIDEAITKTISAEVDFVSAIIESSPRAMNQPQAQAEPGPIVVATPRPTPAPGSVNIRYHALTLTEEEKHAVKDLVDEFNRNHPGLRVNLVTEMSTFPEDLLWYRFFASQFDCFTWYMPHWISDQEEIDSLLNMNVFLRQEPAAFSADFYPGVLEAFRFEGDLYGLPAVSQPEVMYYNADLLARLGIQPPSNDWTFNDFLELITTVAAGSGSSDSSTEKIYGYLFEISESEPFFFNGREVDWADDELEPPVPKFDSPDTLAAMSWLADLKQSGAIWMHNPVTVGGWEVSYKLFKEGRVAFWNDKAGTPTHDFQTSEEFPFTIGVAPMPALPGKEHGPGYLRGHFISSETQNPQACWELFKFLTEQPSGFNGVPSRRSVAESPAWIAVTGPEHAEVYRLALSREGEHHYNLLAGPFYSLRYEAVRDVLLRSKDAQVTLVETQRKAEEYLACISQVDTSRLSYRQASLEVRACYEEVTRPGG